MEYYVGLSIVSGSQGTIHFPTTLRKGFARNLIKDNKKSLPTTLGIGITGKKL